MSDSHLLHRREFVKTAGTAAAVSLLLTNTSQAGTPRRRRYAMVGTGHRGTGMWGVDLAKHYSDVLEFVGLCDTNAKRLAAGRELIGVECPTFTDFDEMLDKVRPELLMVTTVDSTHIEQITRALERGIEVITEKPMVTDERQCRDVLAAER